MIDYDQEDFQYDEPYLSNMASGFGFEDENDFQDYCDQMDREAEAEERENAGC